MIKACLQLIVNRRFCRLWKVLWANCKLARFTGWNSQVLPLASFNRLPGITRQSFHSSWRALFSAAADPLIWEQHPIKDRYTVEVFKAFFREALESGGALIAIDSRDGQVIGSSRFHGYDKEKSEIEIGWTFLARSYWGGGYNKEMKALMLRHAFRFVKSVIFVVGPQNLRSQRAVERIGAVRVGSGPRPDGTGQDSFIYRITAV